MKQLYLIRHGITDWNEAGRAQGHTDIPLNERGRAQARALATRLASHEIHAIYASDLSRASETASIVGEAVGTTPIPAPEFRELNIGELEGADWTEVPTDFGTLLGRVAAGKVPEGGETFDAFLGRISLGLERLFEAHAEETVAIVSHGGTLKTMIGHLLGLDRMNLDRLSLRGNASLSVVEFRHGRPTLSLLNDTSHHE
ncbi:MAG: histidine phosphatase family protein [Planctomycetota bacterium]|jgi:broad specificity phosphatase PhoE